MNKIVGYVSLALFIATIPFANWLIGHVGNPPPAGIGPHTIELWFGLVAPSGVLAIGAALIFRDVAHRSLGPVWVLAGIAVGGLLSLLINPTFAIASAVAFTISELSDMAVYEPLRERGWTLAMICSNVVGATVDSIIFLSIAFGSLAFFWGQFVGKMTMTVVAVALIAIAEVGRRALPSRDAS